MGSQLIKLNAKIFHVVGNVMVFQNIVGHGSLSSFFLRYTAVAFCTQAGSRIGIIQDQRGAVHKISTCFFQCDHNNYPPLISLLVLQNEMCSYVSKHLCTSSYVPV